MSLDLGVPVSLDSWGGPVNLDFGNCCKSRFLGDPVRLDLGVAVSLEDNKPRRAREPQSNVEVGVGDPLPIWRMQLPVDNHLLNPHGWPGTTLCSSILVHRVSDGVEDHLHDLLARQAVRSHEALSALRSLSRCGRVTKETALRAASSSASRSSSSKKR